MPSTVSITVRMSTAIGGGLADLQVALRSLQEHSGAADKAMSHLKGGLVSLAPAAIPVAAALVPIAANAGAAGIAVAAFGAAVLPQFKALSDTAAAQDKYNQAVIKTGPGSKGAATASKVYQAQLDALPPAARKAAAALGDLKASYKGWSDSLAGDTLPVAIKGFGVLEALFPKLTPMVKGASVQMDRLVTSLGGAVAGGAMDRLTKQFSGFATGALQKVVDGVLHFSRLLSEGRADGAVAKFMDYVHQAGPQVRDTLKNLGEAVGHLMQAAAQAGPGMLTLVNAMAGLAASVPPAVLTRLLQMYTAFRMISLAGVGLAAVSSQVGVLTRRVLELNRTSMAAGGGLAGLRAAFMSLGTAARVSVVVAAIGAVVVAMHELGGSGKATVSVDKLTTSLGDLGRTGAVTGALKGNLADLSTSIAMVSKSASDNKIATMVSDFGSWIGLAAGPGISKAKENVDGIDNSLANLVKNGHADLAAAAAARLQKAWIAGGGTAERFNSTMDDYKAALDDAAFEQKLAADSMGLFGDQAVKTQAALDAQKASADGLRQSIQALNDVNRAGLDGMIGFEQAIDDATKAAENNGGVLRMVGGELVLNTDKQRANASALDNLAAKTDSATAAARDSGKSWDYVRGIYDKGRDALIRTAEQMGLTKKQAQALADQILSTPDKTAYLRGDLDDLKKKLADAKARLAHAPKSQTAKIKGEISDLTKKLKTAQAQVDKLHGKTIVVRTNFVNVGSPSDKNANGVPDLYEAHGGIIGAAGGGPRSRRTLVGEQGPEIVDLAPGSMVHTAGDSRRMMAGSGGGGGGPVVLEIRSGGSRMDDLLVEVLRSAVRLRGGDVQTVLGRA